jgi:hypothetical protein
MEWFWNAFWAYLGWNVAAPLFLFLIFVLVYTLFEIARGFKHRNCKHEDYFENGQCHAICRTCRLDLGFIGTWRAHVSARSAAEPPTSGEGVNT